MSEVNYLGTNYMTTFHLIHLPDAGDDMRPAGWWIVSKLFEGITPTTHWLTQAQHTISDPDCSPRPRTMVVRRRVHRRAGARHRDGVHDDVVGVAPNRLG